MKVIEQQLEGVRLVQSERHHDGRGYFQRTFDAELLRPFGLETEMVQSAVSFNRKKGTLRGMHWQVAPCDEAKLVTCLRGGIFDVLVDLREGSKTFRQHVAVELWDLEGLSLYVPRGVAHGFQTLTDDALVGYQLSRGQSVEHARRARFDDPAFGIRWPLPVSSISDADREAPLMGAPR